MRKLADASVGLVVTSPPYNLKKKYRKYQDNLRREEYLAWADVWALEIKRILAPTGSFFLNIGCAPSNPMLPHELLLLMCKHFKLQNTFHWIKSITVETRNGKFISSGHFKPINSRRYVTDLQEFVFHLTHMGNVKLNRLALGVPYADKSNIKRWGHTEGRDRRCRGNTWFISYETIRDSNKQRPHPATFPPRLADNCILLHGEKDITMVDPFVGLGNSAFSAVKRGLSRFIGFDIDDYYLAEATKTLEKLYAKP